MEKPYVDEVLTTNDLKTPEIFQEFFSGENVVLIALGTMTRFLTLIVERFFFVYVAYYIGIKYY